MDLQKFDEMIDTVQRATCIQINEKQKKLLNKNMILNRISNMEEMRKGITLFELQKMLEEMEFYLALKYDEMELTFTWKRRLMVYIMYLLAIVKTLCIYKNCFNF